MIAPDAQTSEEIELPVCIQVSYHREDVFSFIIKGYLLLRCRVNESLMNPIQKDPLAGKLRNATLKSVRPGSADSLSTPSCRMYAAVLALFPADKKYVHYDFEQIR